MCTRGGSNRLKVYIGYKFSQVNRVHTVFAILQLLHQRLLLFFLSFICYLYVPYYCYCYCYCLKTKGKKRKIEAVVAVILDTIERR